MQQSDVSMQKRQSDRDMQVVKVVMSGNAGRQAVEAVRPGNADRQAVEVVRPGNVGRQAVVSQAMQEERQ